MKLLLFFTFISIHCVFAQPNQEAGLPHSHEDYAYVEDIYNHLLKQVGDLRSKTPTLIVSDKLKAKMAIHLVEGKKHTIIVEQTVVKVCKSMGEDGKIAMAFLLGHELTHFYREHENNPAFAASEGSLAEHKHNETEADTHGALLAYLAGYDILKEDEKTDKNVIAQFLDLAYAAYKKADNLEGYQPLSKRKAVVEGIKNEVETLYRLHQFAVLSQVVGWDEQAGECYEYLIDTANIKTKDIIYNSLQADIQLADMLLAQQGSVYDGTSQLYTFPTMLEIENPLLRRKSFLRGALNYELGQINALLKRAAAKLEGLEKHHAPYVKQWAGTSLSAAHLLLLAYLNKKLEKKNDEIFGAPMKQIFGMNNGNGLDQLGAANEILETIRTRIESIGDDDQLAMVALAQGIIHDYKGDNSNAKIYFSEALTLAEDSPAFVQELVEKNGLIFRARELVERNTDKETEITKMLKKPSGRYYPKNAQNIDGVDIRVDVIERLMKKPQTSATYKEFFDQYASVLYSYRKKMKFGSIAYPKSTLYFMQYHDGVNQSVNEFFTIQLTRELKTQEGIKIGATVDQLEKTYGKGKSKSNMTLGRSGEQFISYPDHNLLFCLGTDGKVKEWAVLKHYKRAR